MSTQVTIIILACIIAFCYLVIMRYNYKWNKEKETLNISIEKLHKKLYDVEERLSNQIRKSSNAIVSGLNHCINEKENRQ